MPTARVSPAIWSCTTRSTGDTRPLIDRRVFIGQVALVALAAPRAGRADSARKVYRLGILSLRATSDLVGPQPRSSSIKALLRGLRELGYVYGEHFLTEARGGGGRPDRFPALAAELVRLRMDVILAAGPALPAVKQATSTVPVIMTATLDPVGQGFVQSLGRPGGNFTGFSLQSPETIGKRLELLKELAPSTAPVAVLWDQSSILDWQAAEAAARERGWKLLSLEIRSAGDLEGALKAASDARASALLVSAAGLLFPRARRLTELTAKHRLPSMFGLREYVEAGGLISYGPNIDDIWRRAAVFVDKILRGARPADLPVEQPTKFELLINLGTAKTLGLVIPQSILLQADDIVR
jgi:putative ABC transport system substrate-binding protein